MTNIHFFGLDNSESAKFKLKSSLDKRYVKNIVSKFKIRIKNSSPCPIFLIRQIRIFKLNKILLLLVLTITNLNFPSTKQVTLIRKGIPRACSFHWSFSIYQLQPTSIHFNKKYQLQSTSFKILFSLF